jgi:hypothetical protein
MSRMTGPLAGVAGTMLAVAVALAQAPPQDGGRQGGQAGQGAQAPARGGQGGGQQGGRGRGGGRGGDGGAQTGPSFFVTSVGKGDGGNLGGLAGADAHCTQLAQAAGLPAGRMWRAYLSTTAANGQPAVNARDRIGVGPWYNAKGVLVASNVADLHGDIERDRNQISKATALTEKGTPVGGVGETPNQHDILTGSSSVGRAVAGTTDTTCSNWTSNMAAPSAPAAGRAADATGRGGDSGRGAGGAAAAPDQSGPGALVGHHDRQGDNNSSWNSARRTRGCSQENLVAAGGAGLFYCFAAN